MFQVQFSLNGYKIITASSRRTCRLWSVETGECLQAPSFSWVGRAAVQVLEGHSDECLAKWSTYSHAALFGCFQASFCCCEGMVGHGLVCFKVPSTMRVTL